MDAHEEGLERGWEEGQVEGEIKLTRMLQEVLNISTSNDSEFEGKTLSELQSITAFDRDQIHNRSLTETKLPSALAER